MGCDAKTFSNIDQQVFSNLKSRLAENGLSIGGNSGKISGPFGIVLEYEWNPDSATLYTKVLEKNFLVPCSQVNSILEKAIRECGG